MDLNLSENRKTEDNFISKFIEELKEIRELTKFQERYFESEIIR